MVACTQPRRRARHGSPWFPQERDGLRDVLFADLRVQDGVAIFLETVTDNRMRTTPEIRHIFSKHGCAMGEPNSVAWMFERRGRLMVDASAAAEDQLMDVVLEAGGEDLQLAGEQYEIATSPESLHDVKQALEKFR